MLAHRGPDDQGILTRGQIGLGHRRLSILDLSQAGHQPMGNSDGSIWIVLNGEIYNFLALRRELQQHGYHFRSHTDTEVLLYLYESEGTACLQKLHGMFAFAIWDAREQMLFLARDRAGQKPLVYSVRSDCFLFASEIKALLQDPDVEREVDPLAVHYYLSYQYVPAPLSAFKGIAKLPPAHYLLVRNGKISIHRYWRLEYLPKFPATGARQRQAVRTRLCEELENSVRLRLISDVPLGAFLSGGIDSSAIVALMSRCLERPVKTFSIGFAEKIYNELPFARQVAEYYQTDHTEFYVKPDAVAVLPKLVWYYNEPYADSSAIPTYYVSKLARQHVTVALNGDGGDENFAGYERYIANLLSQRLRKFCPAPLLKMMLTLAMLMPHGHRRTNFFWRLKRFLDGCVASPEESNARWLWHYQPESKRQLYTTDFAATVCDSDPLLLLWHRYREVESVDLLDKLLYTDVMMYLPEDLLVKVDIASMANSLEARSPFLDHRLMEFAARLPTGEKLARRWGRYRTKHILKQSFRDILPTKILHRSKRGFAVPIDYWLRNELESMAWDTLLAPGSIARGYFQRSFIEMILREHRAQKWNWHHQIYNLLMLELWHRQFIDANDICSQAVFTNSF